MAKNALQSTLSKEMDRLMKSKEDWKVRLNAVQSVRSAFDNMEKTQPLPVSSETWKTLVPLKSVLQDLRSQLVKEACRAIAKISEVTGDAMAPLLKDLLPTLLEVRGSGNKVCASYCSECIDYVSSHTVVKGPNLRLIVDYLHESKNKFIRLSCITTLKMAVIHWTSMLDKADVQHVEKALIGALSDASASCRNEALALYSHFQDKYPKRAPTIVGMVDHKVQKRLEAISSSASVHDTASSISADDAASLRAETWGSTHPSAPRTLHVDVGDRVCIPDKEFFGCVRYTGEVDGTKGTWVGVELDEPKGKNDGSVKGKRYFTCEPNCGVFARPHHIVLTRKSAGGSESTEDMLSQLENDLKEGAESVVSPKSNLNESFHDISASVAEEGEGDSELSQVLGQAAVAHRRYLDRLLHYVQSELEEHQRFAEYVSTASSADAVQYLQQLQNSAQDKIVLSDVFIQQMIQAQQSARES